MHAHAVVEARQGKLRGVVSGGVLAFKGVPYGGQVSGNRRWRRAAFAEPWTGIRDAFIYGPRAVQIEHHQLGVTSKEIEDLLLAGGPADESWTAQSENCLTLNVWAPAEIPKGGLPVMVWFHGGGYHGETPPVWWFDGEPLARLGQVVVVSVRHRVGPLGFLYLADLPGGKDYESAGNVGICDLVLALEWIRDNVGAFGADPARVTLFGESGGGTKISVLLAMPSAKGLFSKAIIQSGPQLQAPTRDEGTEMALAVLKALGRGVSDIATLPDVPVEALLKVQVELMRQVRKPWEAKGLCGFQPVIDGRVLLESPFDPVAASNGHDVPLIIGTCATEATFLASGIPGVFDMDEGQTRAMICSLLPSTAERLIAVYRKERPDVNWSDIFFAICSDYMVRMNSIRLAELKVEQGGAPVFMYRLDLKTDIMGGRYGTPHVLDVPLVFGQTNLPILGQDEGRFAVSEQMIKRWASFAYTGDPNAPSEPPWPSYDLDRRQTMIFDTQSQVISDPQREERLAWRSPM